MELRVALLVTNNYSQILKQMFSVHFYFIHSVYVNSHGDLMLPGDQLISNLLAWIGDLKFKKIQISMWSGQVELDPGKSILHLLAQIGEWGSFLSIHTASISVRIWTYPLIP